MCYKNLVNITLISFVFYVFDFFQNYIFALLTGYMDPPAGVTLAENQHYNPYFPLGAIGMAQALYDEVIYLLCYYVNKQLLLLLTNKQ